MKHTSPCIGLLCFASLLSVVACKGALGFSTETAPFMGATFVGAGSQKSVIATFKGSDGSMQDVNLGLVLASATAHDLKISLVSAEKYLPGEQSVAALVEGDVPSGTQMRFTLSYGGEDHVNSHMMRRSQHASVPQSIATTTYTIAESLVGHSLQLKAELYASSSDAAEILVKTSTVEIEVVESLTQQGQCEIPGSEGQSCADASCDAWSSCTYEGACSTAGTQHRTCTSFACADNACSPATQMFTQACGERSVDPIECGQSGGPNNCIGAANDSATWEMSDIELEVIRLMNVERAKESMQPLSPCRSIARASQKHSADMRDRNYFSHTTLGSGAGPGERMCAEGYCSWSGEILVAGTLSAESSVNAWMNSPGHRAIIMTPSNRMVGIGYSCTGISNGAYWTGGFGASNHASCD